MQSSSPDAMRVTPSTARLMSLPRSGLGANTSIASSPLGNGNASDISLSTTFVPFLSSTVAQSKHQSLTLCR